MLCIDDYDIFRAFVRTCMFNSLCLGGGDIDEVKHPLLECAPQARARATMYAQGQILRAHVGPLRPTTLCMSRPTAQTYVTSFEATLRMSCGYFDLTWSA